MGNDKLSPQVAQFDLPAGPTCPGKSKTCCRRCYARRLRFPFPQVQARLRWNYCQAQRADFVPRMVDELFRSGIVLMRWHVAGDMFSRAYARKMLEISGQSQHTAFGQRQEDSERHSAT
jgi:hypothetical protein